MNKISKHMEKSLTIVIIGLSVIMVLYHLLSTQTLIVDPQRHQNLHLLMAFVLVLLASLRALGSFSRQAFILLGALISGIIVMVYVHFQADDLEMRIGIMTTTDLVLGALLVLVVLEACRRAWGMIFPALASAGILYAFFGHYIPEPLGHRPIDPELVLAYLGIGMEGIYGPILYASANLIFPFVIFASLLKGLGGVEFFTEVGKLGGRVLRGGPAQTAVLSSGLVGMCTGAAAANVAITGSFTIPHMKKTGYSPHMAAGIESTASTGGQITPPVMGAAAFIMASFLGISFFEILKMAVLPALLFYVAVGLGVQMWALYNRLEPEKDSINLKLMLQTSLVFVIPIGALIVLLMMRYSPMFAAFWATVTLLVMSLFQKQTRPTIGILITSLQQGAMAGSQIAVGCAAIGMFAGILTFTGLGIKIASLVGTLAGESLAIAAILTALLSILLGCGLPTIAAYVIAGTVAAPVLTRMGVLPEAAHMYVLYFGVFAAITPPVAGACMVACRLAGADYLKTCWEAVKLSVAAYLLPFVMLTTPLILLRTQDPWPEWISFGCMLISMFLIICAAQKYFLNPLVWWERITCVFIASLLMYYVFGRSNLALAAGIISLFIFLAEQIKRNKKKRVLLENPL